MTQYKFPIKLQTRGDILTARVEVFNQDYPLRDSRMVYIPVLVNNEGEYVLDLKQSRHQPIPNLDKQTPKPYWPILEARPKVRQIFTELATRFTGRLNDIEFDLSEFSFNINLEMGVSAADHYSPEIKGLSVIRRADTKRGRIVKSSLRDYKTF